MGDVEDRYMRGIIFTTAASGAFTVFDEIALATRVASLLIFLQIAGVITAMVAFNCLVESRIYKFGSKSPMNINREYAKFAATATQSMTVFKQLVSNDSTYGHLTEADLKKCLSQGPIQDGDAEEMAGHIIVNGDIYKEVDPNDPEQVANGHGLEYGHNADGEDEEKKGYLTFVEYLDTITEDTMSLDFLRDVLNPAGHDFVSDGHGHVTAGGQPSSNVERQEGQGWPRLLPEQRDQEDLVG